MEPRKSLRKMVLRLHGTQEVLEEDGLAPLACCETRRLEDAALDKALERLVHHHARELVDVAHLILELHELEHALVRELVARQLAHLALELGALATLLLLLLLLLLILLVVLLLPTVLALIAA